MKIEKLNDILNDFYSLDTTMYDIFKKQLTGNYSSESEYWKDQKQWNAWIRLLIKDYLPLCGQPNPTTFTFRINTDKLKTLINQPQKITNFSPDDYELAMRLTKSEDFVAYKELFPLNKEDIQSVISSMNLRDFRQLVNIIYHIGLYESFKKILTNCETIKDFNNFGNELVRFLANS
jgi:hypothetical protein